MRPCFLLAASLLALAAPAYADDAVHVGPAPAWVTKVEEPPAVDTGGAVVPRLVDLQNRIDAEGTHSYARRIFAIKAPEALGAMGTIGGVWQPAFDRITFHSAVIHRGAATIDVLKDGKGFTVLRRETGLENGFLDGQLTAAMQVPDLRVGDELELAYTVDHKNPVFGDHADFDTALIGGVTVDRLFVRTSWPSARKVRWRAGDGLPKPVVASAGGETALTIDRKDFTMPQVAAGAPLRFLDAGRLQIGDYADWGELSGQIAGLFEAAATLAPGSPVRAEIARISTADSDPKARAEAALALVQSQVRYFARVDGLGGYKPETADAVWAARAGDCKGKSVLLVAMLRALGIDAEPALVSSGQGDGADASLPVPSRFDHVIVRATISGRTYWLDGTRLGDRALDRIAVPDFHWALPLRAKGATLVAMVATEPTEPQVEWRLDLDASKGIGTPALATGEAVMRGDAALQIRSALTILNQTQRDEFLRRLWTERHDWVEIEKVSSTIDDAAGTVRIGFTGTGTMDWSLTGSDAKYRYEANKARMGRGLDPDRPAGVGATLPVLVGSEYSLTRQTIILPKDMKGFFVEGDQIDETIAGIHYMRTASIKDGRFQMEAVTRSKAGEISLADAKAADKKTDALFARQLFVRMPYDWNQQVTPIREATIKTNSAVPPVYSDVYALLEAKKPEEALRRVDEDIAKSGKVAPNLALKAWVLFALKRLDEGDAVLDNAIALDPTYFQGLDMKASRMMQQRRFDDAAIIYDRMVLAHPEMPASYLKRAAVRELQGKREAALSDLTIALEKQPDNVDALFGRVKVLQSLGRREEALAATDAYLKLVPDGATALALKANLLLLMGRREEATALLDHAIATAPAADFYMLRLDWGVEKDSDAALTDMLALIKMSPGRILPREPLARAASNPAQAAALKAAYDEALKAKTLDADSSTMMKAFVDASAGNTSPLFGEIDRRAQLDPKSPTFFNIGCWERAVRHVELDKALVLCNSAIALNADPGFLDSRALVYLQRDQPALALADYQKILDTAPNNSAALFGRGIARLRLGDAKSAADDFTKAHSENDKIEATFASYGISRDKAK